MEDAAEEEPVPGLAGGFFGGEGEEDGVGVRVAPAFAGRGVDGLGEGVGEDFGSGPEALRVGGDRFLEVAAGDGVGESAGVVAEVAQGDAVAVGDAIDVAGDGMVEIEFSFVAEDKDEVAGEELGDAADAHVHGGGDGFGLFPIGVADGADGGGLAGFAGGGEEAGGLQGCHGVGRGAGVKQEKCGEPRFHGGKCQVRSAG